MLARRVGEQGPRDAVQAFELLLRASQNSNTKLVEVARFVVTDRGYEVTP